MAIYLHGLSLQFYRGIGPEEQNIGPFSDFNFFVGPNNAGKSTVLNFISRYLPLENHEYVGHFQPEDLEEYMGSETGKFSTAIHKPTLYFRRDIVQSNPKFAFGELSNSLDLILDTISDNGLLKVEIPQGSQAPIAYQQKRTAKVRIDTKASLDRIIERNLVDLFYHIYPRLTGHLAKQPKTNEVLERTILGGIVQKLGRETRFTLPKAILIPAFRKISETRETATELSGVGLVDQLFKLQNPSLGKEFQKKSFNRIQNFVREVIDEPNATIEIPHDLNHLLVEIHGKRLPLENLGTGIEEVVMLAAYCTIHQDQIICIEEPEIHLHPLLQRKLIAYLKQHTNNQYFIATHSASLIDTKDAAVFRVTNDGTQTRITKNLLQQDHVDLIRDLGYRASDLVQANAVIWVEGPSDRIYINHWLKAVAPELVEGIDYSIMFYGGRLLSHLTGSDAVDELINLRKINQNIAIVLDSDKSSKGDTINKTKQRVIDELTEGNAVSWITQGREIENYVDHTALQAAVKEAHPTLYGSASRGGQFDHALNFERKAPDSKGNSTFSAVDKVRVARAVCKSPANLDILDLKSEITKVAEMIKTAN